MVSVNTAEKVLILTNQKCLSDESVLKKIERFSEQGVERDFFVDGKKIAKITPRLTIVYDAQNWLSMQPNPLRWNCADVNKQGFGEVNENNILHGRGIRIWNDGTIFIGYGEDGRLCTGNEITIYPDGWFDVGETYIKDGKKWKRFTRYMTDGTEEKYGFD